MIPHTAWQTEEIDKLRIDFLKGLSIKSIARELNRSPGSVNKALSRFQIRAPRTYKDKSMTASSWYHRKKKYHSEKDQPILNPWTSFKKMIQWLHTQNIPVEEQNNHYIIEGRSYTPMQVVMYANKRRLHQGEEIFLVEDVTW